MCANGLVLGKELRKLLAIIKEEIHGEVGKKMIRKNRLQFRLAKCKNGVELAP